MTNEQAATTAPKKQKKRKTKAQVEKIRERDRNLRASAPGSLLEEAKPYCNDKGLVVKLIPEELFDALKKHKLVKSGDDIFEPNVEGLLSRWWVYFDEGSVVRICKAIGHSRHRKRQKESAVAAKETAAKD